MSTNNPPVSVPRSVVELAARINGRVEPGGNGEGDLWRIYPEQWFLRPDLELLIASRSPRLISIDHTIQGLYALVGVES